MMKTKEEIQQKIIEIHQCQHDGNFPGPRELNAILFALSWVLDSETYPFPEGIKICTQCGRDTNA